MPSFHLTVLIVPFKSLLRICFQALLIELNTKTKCSDTVAKHSHCCWTVGLLVLALPPIGYMILQKLLNMSMPLFPHQ